jgi:hypothetical protein
MSCCSSCPILAGLGLITSVNDADTSALVLSPFFTGTGAEKQAVPGGAPAGVAAGAASNFSLPTETWGRGGGGDSAASRSVRAIPRRRRPCSPPPAPAGPATTAAAAPAASSIAGPHRTLMRARRAARRPG